MAEPMSAGRFAEIRDMQVDSTAGEAPYNPDIWTLDEARRELVAEVQRLRSEQDGVRDDERRRCIEELRSHSKERMDQSVIEYAGGKEAALSGVSSAAALAKAADLLEAGGLAEQGGGA
ncbi:hypothetical protein [Sphaerisporangium sp. TRM90804]|uniref:hypothetical protein n=1 Tax=Sphaerisporangium sp. TRM90804 TaxID=3031113 RepID=UPI00244C5A80|nr:hypothetical protein [Sphaerisporangium sp. TRM90804]MDH2424827.1 hypothetical protein [Sphaerisporangium sp. TRM90804]